MSRRSLLPTRREGPAEQPPRSRGSWTKRLLLIVAVALVPAWIFVLQPFLQVAVGYSATVAALQHFAAGDSLETLRRERIPSKIGFVSIAIDEDARAVEASVLFVRSRAVYREGLGATREETRRVELPAKLRDLVATPPPTEPWPLGSSAEVAEPAPSVNAARLELAVEAAFEAGRGTHAVVVIHRGELVFERYAEPYDRRTTFLGWSMTKSVTATLLARLVHEGRLSLESPPEVAAWADEARAEITFDDLLRMRSGLAFYQDHATPFCKSLRMLFVEPDCAAFAANVPLAEPVGAHWMYSDGTTNILAGLVLDAVSDDLTERLEAPQSLLFAPLGMDTAFIAVDGAGTFIGSSLMVASARDWARFGLLYANDGVWNGWRLLPEGWVDYVARPTENSARLAYGAHFWRIELGPLAGVFSAKGYQGQVVFIDRARQVVLVRLGVEPRPFDEQTFAEDVLGSFPIQLRD